MVRRKICLQALIAAVRHRQTCYPFASTVGALELHLGCGKHLDIVVKAAGRKVGYLLLAKNRLA